MKIYLAARYAERAALQDWRIVFQNNGHMITSRWLDRADTDDDRRRFAEEDLADVDAADVLVIFSPRAYFGTGRGGRHVEFGYALAKGKPIVLVGEPENVFHWCRNVTVTEADGVLAALAAAQAALGAGEEKEGEQCCSSPDKARNIHANNCARRPRDEIADLRARLAVREEERAWFLQGRDDEKAEHDVTRARLAVCEEERAEWKRRADQAARESLIAGDERNAARALLALAERERKSLAQRCANAMEIVFKHERRADQAARERADLRACLADARRKLAEAGVEGSPPPGEDTTIGRLRASLTACETQRDALQEMWDNHDAPHNRLLADLDAARAALAQAEQHRETFRAGWLAEAEARVKAEQDRDALASTVADLTAALDRAERRRCLNGHEQDPLWSLCRLCQYGEEIDALRSNVIDLTASLKVAQESLRQREAAQRAAEEREKRNV